MSVREAPHGALLGALAAIVVATLVASVTIGYAPLDLRAAASDALSGEPSLGALVLTELRLPRAIMGASSASASALRARPCKGFSATRSPTPG